jgi:tRNA U34 2-thiouridine synthase MnmA/TrmU
VAVLLSGGVDSSVALRLLHAAGHSCTAFYLKIWFQVHTLSRILVLQCYAAGSLNKLGN